MSLINNLISPLDIRLGIADRLKRIRLDQNVSQEQLAERSGVSLESLRRFESKGEISLKSLVHRNVLSCAFITQDRGGAA